MREIIAAAGAVSITAMSVVAPPEVTLTANVLTVTGYTAAGLLNFDMDELFQGAYCSAAPGNTCTPVRYSSGDPFFGEYDGLRALTAAISTAQSPTTVVGFSQGSTISSEWLRKNAGKPGAPSPEDLSFVLVANPLRKYGGVRHALDASETTPDTEYEVLDIAVEYDGAADFPDNPFNLLAVANALAGFQYVHISGYDDIDLDNAEKLVWQDGNTTYVLVRSQDIPLLEPLRILGLDDVADKLNDPLKAIIDSAYDRDYPGLVDPSLHDDVLQQFSASEGDENDVQATSFDSSTSERVAQADDSVVEDIPEETDSETEKPVDDGESASVVSEDDVTIDAEPEASDEDDAESPEPADTESVEQTEDTEDTEEADEAPSKIDDSADDEQASDQGDTDAGDDSADAGDSKDDSGNSAE